MASNWLVTGGCGFIGRAILRRLAAGEQAAIRIVDNLSESSREDLLQICEFMEVPGSADPLPPLAPGTVQLVVGDIRDEHLALRAAAGIDIVVHLAANTGVAPSVEDPRQDCLSNVIGTLNYLEACRHGGVSRFVFASSGAPLGAVDPPVHEELCPHPMSPYGASKLSGEAYCSAYFHSYGIHTVALRFGNVYGPGSSRKSSVVAKFIRQAMHGEALEVYGDGAQTRDFVYVEDLADAVLRAARHDQSGGEVYQIATSTELSVNEMVERLIPVLHAHGIPSPRLVQGPPRVGDVKRMYSDTRKARTRLGWRAKVELDEGLRRTVQWFVDRESQSLDPPGSLSV